MNRAPRTRANSAGFLSTFSSSRARVVLLTPPREIRERTLALRELAPSREGIRAAVPRPIQVVERDFVRQIGSSRRFAASSPHQLLASIRRRPLRLNWQGFLKGEAPVRAFPFADRFFLPPFSLFFFSLH